MNYGEQIKRLRIDSGLTQAELAKRSNISEISIRKYENNDRNPKIDTLLRIAHALGVSIETFLDDNAFDVITNGTAEEETAFLQTTIDNITEIDKNDKIDSNEKQSLIENHLTTLRIMNAYHEANVSAAERYLSSKDTKNKIEFLLSKLNYIGKIKAAEQIELLTKIPEYQKNPPQATPHSVNAAHDRTDTEFTPEDRQANRDKIDEE